MQGSAVRTIAEEVDICSNDDDSTDEAVKEIQLDAGFRGLLKQKIMKHTFSYPTPTMMPMILFFVAKA